jgi:signal transduction histidine kinase
VHEAGALSAEPDEGDARTETIARLGALHHPRLDELRVLVELAATYCDAPKAAINMITATHQHQVAAYGMDGSVCRVEDSMCASVLREQAPIVVPDASLDVRFRDNPFVTGVIGRVRFYASHKLVTSEGVTIGTLCVFDEQPRDLSERQRHALGVLAARIVDLLELGVQRRQLAESNERLAEFAARVSHDLREPLTSMTVSLEMARDGIAEGEDPARLAWLLDKSVHGSRRMVDLISEILEFATYDGTLVRTDVDLGVVLDQVVLDLEIVLAGVELRREPLPLVVGNPVQLRSVLQNLLHNAAKYRHPDRAPVVSVSAERLPSAWRVAVTDNGLGVPPADRERVFERGVRIDAASAPGSGIGLHNCRQVMESHGGRIGVEPVPGGGSTFWFELPA